MKQRLALLTENAEDAKLLVQTLRAQGFSDESIYVVARSDVTLDDLPEAGLRQYSDVFPAAKRGAAIGGTLGLFSGLLMATVPPAGIAVGGAAIATLAAGGAAFGAWTRSLVGISVPHSALDAFHAAINDGKVVTVVDADSDAAGPLLAKLRTTCRAQLLQTANLDAA